VWSYTWRGTCEGTSGCTLWFLYSPRIARSLGPQPARSAFRVARYRPGIGAKGIGSHGHSHKTPSAPTRRCQLRNCSDGPNSRAQLFTKPFVSRFMGESGMPCHEIRRGLDLTRRFHDAHTSHDRSDLCQSARYGENQVSLSDGKDCAQRMAE
jgi:hypothetical protein